MRNKYLLFAMLFFIILTIFSLNIPFFWDGTFFSQIALNIFERGFSHIIDTDQPDTGGFPMYSLYMAAVWKLFGKSLAISHLALLPFLCGICNEYFKLAKRFLESRYIPVAFLFLISEPVLVTQSVLMGYDILMVFFFLFALNALLNNKSLLFSIALALLCLSSMRGIFAGISLLIIDFLINRKQNLILKKYVPALSTIFIWAFIHHSLSGWYFFSPQRESTHEALLPLLSIFRQIVFILWKVCDEGHIALWLFILIVFIIRKPKDTQTILLRKLLMIPLITLMLAMSLFANPVGPKYFIIIFLLLNIFCAYMLQLIISDKLRTGISTILIIFLVSGNFWMYPERFGNTWDSSLKVLPYFHLKGEMDDYVSSEHINPALVGTQFPLIADEKISYLNENKVPYTNVWSGPVSDYQYFLQTNVINTDIPSQIEDVKAHWTLLKRIKSGQVYMELYKNAEH